MGKLSRQGSVFDHITVEGTNDIRAPASENIDLRMGDNAGANAVVFNDSDGVTVASINSDGIASFSGGTFLADDVYLGMGNVAATPDARLGWNTAQTVDALFLGLSDAQNTFVIAENGDRAFDFAHGAQTNPTVFGHSAAQNTTQWWSLTHDQTNAVFAVGAGGLTLPNNVGIAIAPGADTALMVGGAAVNDSTRLTVIAHTRTDVAAVTPIANYILSSANPAGASASSFHGQFVISRTETGLAQYVSALVGANFSAVSNLNAANTTTTATGFLGQASNTGGTTTTARGAWLGVINVSGTITTAQTMFVATPQIDAGTIGTAYGLYVDNITGATTANYGAYIVGGSTAALAIVQAAVAGGSPAALTITGGAHTALTAATEDIGANFNFSATKTWAAGAGPLATQREVLFQAPTYVGNAAGALTVSRADTVSITGAPIAGANITLTEANALYVGGQMRLDSQLQWGAGVAVTAGQYSVGRNADATNRLQLNVPTGAIHEISVNDVAIVFVTATTLQTLLGSAAQPSLVSLADTNTGLYWSGSDVLGFSTNGTSRMTIANSVIVMTQGVATTGSPVGLTFTGGAHTTLTASAEATDINFNFTRTVQFSTGALTTQRAMQIGQPTYGFVAASTLSTAISVEIAGPPRAGTNATITNSYGLVVGRGDSGNPVDTASVAMISVNMPDIASGVGAMTNLIGFEINSNAVVLGDQTATLSAYIGASILAQTLTSSVLTRTITTATTLNVSGPPIASTNVTITNPARAVIIGGGAVTGGLAQELLVTMGAHTGMTASTEVASVFLDFSATKQWATGAMVTQRDLIISAPTYGFVGASTITSAYTVDINRPPRAGTNATITSAAGLNIGGVGSDANATNSLGLSIYPLAIRNGYGAMTSLVGIGVSDAGLGISLGNQTATLTNLNAIRLEAITYTSTDLVRTVTNPATLYIGGAPVASTNVTFSNTARAIEVAAGTVEMNDHIVFNTGVAVTATDYSIGRDADGTNQLHLNIPTGATVEFSVNDVAAWTSGASVFTTAANTDVNMSAGGRLYGGGIQANYQTLAANTNLTLDENDSVVEVTTGAGSNNTITLPAASGNQGMIISVYLITDGGLDAVITRAGADVIQNGSADLANTTVTLNDAGDYALLQCVSASMWQVVVNSGGVVA